jgi:hypothetical protein
MAKNYERYAEIFALKLSGKSQTAELQEELYSLADDQARAIHLDYIASQRGLGYAAPNESTEEHPVDDELIDSELVDYDALPEEVKDIRMAATDTARKLYIMAHKPLVKELELMLYRVAEHIHLEWARDMTADGWTYAPVEDEEEKKSPYLVPFAVIVNDPELEENAEYFVEVARTLLFNLLDEIDYDHPVLRAANKIADLLK